MARFTTARAASHGHRGRPTSSPGASAKSNTPIAWGPRRATKPISGPTERGAPRSAPSITRVHKPATLGAGLTDSPAGLAAWISEKVVAWSSTRADGSPAFDWNLLLETLTLYWVTETISTSLLPYWAARRGTSAGLPVDDPCPVPTAVTVFGGELVPFPKPPRSLAERCYSVSAWAEHPLGGHFPAFAAPELLASTLHQALQSQPRVP